MLVRGGGEERERVLTEDETEAAGGCRRDRHSPPRL
jgi:hypothetical protein